MNHQPRKRQLKHTADRHDVAVHGCSACGVTLYNRPRHECPVRCCGAQLCTPAHVAEHIREVHPDRAARDGD